MPAKPIRSRRRARTIRGLLLTIVTTGLIVAAWPQDSSQVTGEDIEALRRRMDELALKRLDSVGEELPWETDSSFSMADLAPGMAVLRLTSETYKLGVLWIIRPLDSPKEPPVRACILHQGEEWLVLPAGDYEVTLHAGQADKTVVALKPRRVTMRKSSMYLSAFSLATEDFVMRRIREIEPKSEAPDE